MSVYSIISSHFADTRSATKVWSSVNEFTKGLSPGGLILDAGCGSGKNMNLRHDCEYIGIDNCQEFIDICKQKGYNAKYGNITSIPFHDSYFTDTMCIAVIHHIRTRELRVNAIKELVRVTKPGGTIVIQVWAKSAALNPKRESRFELINEQSDYNVKWLNKTDRKEYIRFYHMYESLNELKDEVISASSIKSKIHGYEVLDNYVISFIGND
uniref:Methyltransferase type 11 domain-containing protein n=1 Tax=viral metagenome TaxID=1070528 RepID=A0A6C0J5U9_9ZZZZ